MVLKIKQTANEAFTKEVLKQNERVQRLIPVSDEVFKKIKIKAITENTTMYELLNNALLNILQNKPEIKAVKDNADANKRSFALNAAIFNQVKLFAAERGLKVQDVLVCALESKND